MPEPNATNKERLEFAQWLEEERLGIITEWMNAVRDDRQIPDADGLTLAALQDHCPQMLGELILGLREPATLLDAESRRAANDHGKARWRQGYRLDEVLRELARIREIILARVRHFCTEHELSALRDDVEERVRRFFDLMVAHSARQFMREQETEVTLRGEQLDQAYEQVRSATDQLRAIALSRVRLLRGVSHELRNALNMVGLGASDLLEERNLANRNSIISKLSWHAGSLQRILDRLHRFADILAGDTKLKTALVNLGEFLEAVEKTHRPSAERKGLQFKCAAAPSPSTVTTDPEKLRHIADILLSNAVEYTDHGSIEVATHSGDAGRWILSVVDTGMGIHEIDARLLFEEFHRSERPTHRGVGLGLIIARHLARLMKGDITFQTRHGEGSRFEVSLPTELEAPAA